MGGGSDFFWIRVLEQECCGPTLLRVKKRVKAADDQPGRDASTRCRTASYPETDTARSPEICPRIARKRSCRSLPAHFAIQEGIQGFGAEDQRRIAKPPLCCQDFGKWSFKRRINSSTCPEPHACIAGSTPAADLLLQAQALNHACRPFDINVLPLQVAAAGEVPVAPEVHEEEASREWHVISSVMGRACTLTAGR